MNLNKSIELQFLNNGEEYCIQSLLPYTKQYGNRCMSYSTLQPGLNHILIDEIGYISWIEINGFLPGGHAVVLSNPVTAPGNELLLIKTLETQQRDITLIQIGRCLAESLYILGYKVYQMGIENEIDLVSYSLKGGNKASLRQWRNKALREGVTVEERKLSEIAPREIKSLTNDWLKGRGGRELSFLTRPMPDKDQYGVRFFWARKKGQLIGLAGFDPIFSKGRIIAYYHNFDRIISGAVNGTSAFILLEAIKKFQKEGIKRLNIGLSPLAGMDAGFNLTGPLLNIASALFEHGEKVYPFKGNARHKSKFCGQKKQVYVASNCGWFRTITAAAAACGLKL